MDNNQINHTDPNNIQQEENTKNQLNHQVETTKNPLIIYLSIGTVAFLIIIGLFINFFNSKTQTQIEPANTMSFETKDKAFIDLALEESKKENNSVQDLEHKGNAENNTDTCKECSSLSGKSYENCMRNLDCPLAKTYNTPKIYKFGAVMVAQNNEVSSNSEDNANNLALYDKPNTVLEFGQNGGGILNNPILQANMALANSQGSSAVNSNTRGEGGNGEVFSPSIANFSKFNPSLLLTKGTYIGCSLKTRLVSEIKGGIACIVSNDVYSSNGHTLLIEKGSLVSGTYSNEGINDGSNRIYVIWQEIRTPNNIVIPVFSGASDTLGGAGISGYVDYHYFKRFGSAILVSLIDDVMGAITQKIARQNSTNYYDYSENTREGVSDLASETLKKMIDIKPTLYKNHGDIVGIYVNKDIDFSKVYTLRSKK